MLTDAEWGKLEPLIEAAGRGARPRPRICFARSRPSSGGIRTGPSGELSRLSWVPGRAAQTFMR
jgi:hypothetical protein